MGEMVKVAAKKSEAKRENKASQIQKKGPSQSISSPVEQILFLQRTIGNQAVGRLIKSGALQAKLRIVQPGDIYEQEADRVAEQVMRMPEPEMSNETKVSNPAGNNSIMRKCPGCKKGTKIGKEEEEIKLQKKEASGSTHEVTPELESSISAIRGGGQPLPESVRAFYEPRFGHDFSQVRVHTDTKAAESAQAVNAKAYTVGHDVVFGAGQYGPNINEGKQLIAHELTHVVQQEKASLKLIQPEVRGMVTERLEGRSPESRELGVIRSSLEGAKRMVRQTVNRMHGIHNILLPGSDPRLYGESQREITYLFSRHLKSRRAIDAFEVRENYQYILNALNSLGRNSFRVVPDAVAQRETEGDIYAYVYGRNPIIYLAESFFGELQGIQATARVTVGSRILSPEQKGRIIIHETAHFRLGILHSGGIYGFDVVNCSQGLPVRTSSQAMGNAYVYDHFAYCISQ